MELADILSEGAVIVCDHVKDKSELLELLAERAADLTGLPQNDLYEALAAREELGSTGLGNGIAIPHGKVAGLKGVVALFARLVEPIDFGAVDDQKVDLVMTLLAPVGMGADHLKALARVARLLRSEEVVERLRATQDPAELYAILLEPIAEPAAA